MQRKSEKWFYFSGGIQDGTPVWARVTPTGIEYPWAGRLEVLRDCKLNNAIAVFEMSEAKAREALRLEMLKDN